MAAKSGGKVIFVKSRLYILDILGVENFAEIPLSHTVKEIEANLCFSIFGKNSKFRILHLECFLKICSSPTFESAIV